MAESLRRLEKKEKVLACPTGYTPTLIPALHAQGTTRMKELAKEVEREVAVPTEIPPSPPPSPPPEEEPPEKDTYLLAELRERLAERLPIIKGVG